MYVLYCDNEAVLHQRTELFQRHFEPLLKRLEHNIRSYEGAAPPELEQYLQVCRWPFRTVEYSFVLDALLHHTQPGDRFLDAGCGVTPLGHAVADLGLHVDACDADQRLIDKMGELDMNCLYGSSVNYSAQDLTRLTYPDATFDAIACVSVLEHIPAPHDQQAIRELLRVLKPDGLLVITVDFTPMSESGKDGQLEYRLARLARLAQRGDIGEILRGGARKVGARLSVAGGAARKPRSANECFTAEHLELDVLPLLSGTRVESSLSFPAGLRSVTRGQARAFWNLRPGLFELQGQRDVLPAAVALRRVSA